MRRKVKIRLTRRARKRLVTVQVLVHQVTLGGFIEVLRVAGHKVEEFQAIVRKGEYLVARDIWLALAHPEFCAGIADVLCPDRPRGWFRPWWSQANIARMIEAARATSDWGRLVEQLRLPGPGKKPSRKSGSLYADAILLGRILSVNPQEIIDAWPMERFLDLCDAVIRDTEAAKEEEMLEDPTMDPEAKPTPLTNVLPGRGKVWVN